MKKPTRPAAVAGLAIVAIAGGLGATSASAAILPPGSRPGPSAQTATGIPAPPTAAAICTGIGREVGYDTRVLDGNVRTTIAVCRTASGQLRVSDLIAQTTSNRRVISAQRAVTLNANGSLTIAQRVLTVRSGLEQYGTSVSTATVKLG